VGDAAVGFYATRPDTDGCCARRNTQVDAPFLGKKPLGFPSQADL
jgi:hypothetical protein